MTVVSGGPGTTTCVIDPAVLPLGTHVAITEHATPDVQLSGISVSLQMVFAVIVGGVYVSLGPTVGAIITILLAEILRIGFGTRAVGWDNLVYGVLLVLFIIFLPKGILGSVIAKLKTQLKMPQRS